MSIDTRGLSRRAQDMLAGGSEPEYLRRHSECLSDLFDPVTNPDGYIALCEAENRLVAEMVADRLDRVPKVPPTALFYDTMTGALRFREQLASFMGRTFLGREFDPQQISVLAGAGPAPAVCSRSSSTPLAIRGMAFSSRRRAMPGSGWTSSCATV
jgi:hypothetical protein